MARERVARVREREGKRWWGRGRKEGRKDGRA